MLHLSSLFSPSLPPNLSPSFLPSLLPSSVLLPLSLLPVLPSLFPPTHLPSLLLSLLPPSYPPAHLPPLPNPPPPPPPLASFSPSPLTQIEGMTCSSCVHLIERALMSKTGVEKAVVALSTSKGHVEFDHTILGPRDVIEIIEVCAGGGLGV